VIEKKGIRKKLGKRVGKEFSMSDEREGVNRVKKRKKKKRIGNGAEERGSAFRNWAGRRRPRAVGSVLYEERKL